MNSITKTILCSPGPERDDGIEHGEEHLRLWRPELGANDSAYILVPYDELSTFQDGNDGFDSPMCHDHKQPEDYSSLYTRKEAELREIHGSWERENPCVTGFSSTAAISTEGANVFRPQGYLLISIAKVIESGTACFSLTGSPSRKFPSQIRTKTTVDNGTVAIWYILWRVQPDAIVRRMDLAQLYKGCANRTDREKVVTSLDLTSEVKAFNRAKVSLNPIDEVNQQSQEKPSGRGSNLASPEARQETADAIAEQDQVQNAANNLHQGQSEHKRQAETQLQAPSKKNKVAGTRITISSGQTLNMTLPGGMNVLLQNPSAEDSTDSQKRVVIEVNGENQIKVLAGEKEIIALVLGDNTTEG